MFTIILQIIHLDGVQARPPKNKNFNNGNVPYELQIRSNTKINYIGKYEPKEENPKPIITTISNALKFHECICKYKFNMYIHIHMSHTR